MSKKWQALIFGTLFLIYFIWSGYSSYQLHHNFGIVKGNISGISTPGWKSSGDYSLIYQYEVDGKIYHGNENYNLCNGQTKDKIASLLINQTFPVAYSKDNNDMSVMILTQSLANQFSVTISDSIIVCDSILTCK